MSLNLKNIYKEHVQKPLMVGALATGMALTGPFGTAVADDNLAEANAANNNVAAASAANTSSLSSTNTSSFQHSVRMRDSSDGDPQAVTIGASIASAKADAMMIIYSGSDRELQDKVHQAASLARNDGKRVLGMTVVREYDVIGPERFVVAFNGSSTFPRDPAALSQQDIQDFIGNVQEDSLIPSVLRERAERVADASVPSVTTVASLSTRQP